MGVMIKKPIKVVEKLEDALGTLLKDIINIILIDGEYKVYKREKLITSFKIKPMPGQCGVAVIYNLEAFTKKDIGELLIAAALDICREQEFTMVQVSLIKDSSDLLKLLEENKFELSFQFRNYRTKNAVLIMHKKIREVK